MIVYPSTFTNFNRIDRDVRGNTSDATLVNDKVTVGDYIKTASDTVAEAVGHTYVPYIGTRYIPYSNLIGYKLKLDADLLSITSLTDASGTTIDSDLYRLSNRNGGASPAIQFSTSASWGIDSNGFNSEFAIAGIWGFHPTYASAWQATGATASTIGSASTTSISVSSVANISIWHYIQIDSEWMQVTDISGTTLTVRRGVNGSTADTHTNGASISVFQVYEMAQTITTRIVTAMYRNRHNAGDTLRLADGTIVVTGNDPVVVSLANLMTDLHIEVV